MITHRAGYTLDARACGNPGATQTKAMQVHRGAMGPSSPARVLDKLLFQHIVRDVLADQPRILDVPVRAQVAKKVHNLARTKHVAMREDTMTRSHPEIMTLQKRYHALLTNCSASMPSPTCSFRGSGQTSLCPGQPFEPIETNI